MLVEEIMTRDPVTVTERVSVGEAMSVLAEQGIRHLPVVRGTELVGILSDRDFSSLGIALVQDEHGFAQLRARLAEPVSVLMTAGVVTVSVESELYELVELMIDEKLSAVPVVEADGEGLVGIVSYIDVLRALESLLESD